MKKKCFWHEIKDLEKSCVSNQKKNCDKILSFNNFFVTNKIVFKTILMYKKNGDKKRFWLKKTGHLDNG